MRAILITVVILACIAGGTGYWVLHKAGGLPWQRSGGCAEFKAKLRACEPFVCRTTYPADRSFTVTNHIIGPGEDGRCAVDQTMPDGMAHCKYSEKTRMIIGAEDQSKLSVEDQNHLAMAFYSECEFRPAQEEKAPEERKSGESDQQAP